MHKTVDSLLLRAICALMLGTILILWSEAAIIYLVIITGILFIILGLIPTILYFTHNTPFPYFGLFFLIFGITLVSVPDFFVNVLMYLFGTILVIGGIQQIFALMGARKWANVPVVFYVLPALIVAAGVLILFNPFGAAVSIFILTGITCLIYGITEFVNWMKFR